MSMWAPYVSVSQRRAQAQKKMDKLKKQGTVIEPVEITGRHISIKFWGKKWCDHLDTFADYDNRLPRGRTYARNGSICHLNIQEGKCEAIVSGSSLYKIEIKIKPLSKHLWDEIKERCSGKIGSILELLQGQLSDHVMEVVADHKLGLFPKKNEITYSCDCPDWADMCKHVAAVFYGIGNRLDHNPELLFKLRGVDASELVCTNFSVNIDSAANQLEGNDLGAIFGIELDNEEKPAFDKPLKNNLSASKKTSKQKSKPIKIETLTGTKLRTLREKKGMNVNALAEALGVTSATVHRWEQNSEILKLSASSREALEGFLN